MRKKRFARNHRVGLVMLMMAMCAFWSSFPVWAAAADTDSKDVIIDACPEADLAIGATGPAPETTSDKMLYGTRTPSTVSNCIETFYIEDNTLAADGTEASYSKIWLKFSTPGDLWFDILYNGAVCDDTSKVGGYVQTAEITEDELCYIYYKAPVLEPTAELSGTMALTLRVTHQQSGDYRLIQVNVEIGEYVPPVTSEIRISTQAPYVEYGTLFSANIAVYKDGAPDSATHTLHITSEPAEFGFEGDIEVRGGETTLDFQAGNKTLVELIDEEFLSDVLTYDRVTITAEDNATGISATYSIPLGKPLSVFLDPFHGDDTHALIPADSHFPVRILAVVGGSRDDPRWDQGQNTKPNREVAIELTNKSDSDMPSTGTLSQGIHAEAKTYQTDEYGMTTNAAYYYYHLYGYHLGCPAAVFQCPQYDRITIEDSLTATEETASVATGLLLKVDNIVHAEQPSGILSTPVAIKARVSSMFSPDLDLQEFCSRFVDPNTGNYEYGIKMEVNWFNQPEKLGWWGWIKNKFAGSTTTAYNGTCAIGENGTLIAREEPAIEVGGLNLPGVTIGETGAYFFTVNLTPVDLISGTEFESPAESVGKKKYSFGLAVSDVNEPYIKFIACALNPDSHKEKVLLEIAKRMPVAGGTAAKITTLADIACKLQNDQLRDAMLAAGAFVAGETLNIIDKSYDMSLSDRERELLEFALTTNQIADYQSFLDALLPDVRLPNSVTNDNLYDLSAAEFHDMSSAFVEGILGDNTAGKRVITVLGADTADIVDVAGIQALSVDDIGEDLSNLGDMMKVTSGSVTTFIIDNDKNYTLTIESDSYTEIRVDDSGDCDYIRYSFNTGVFTASSLDVTPDNLNPLRVDYQGDGSVDENVWPTGQIPEEPQLASITLSPPSVFLFPGEMQQLMATARDQFGNKMSGMAFDWTSSSPEVGTVDIAGLFTAVAEGATTVTAARGTVRITAKVSVLEARGWIRLLGTTESEDGQGVAVDSEGNVYITGQTKGNLDGHANAGANDVFIVKYDAGGNKHWTRLLGSAENDFGNGIAVDASHNVYIAGTTEGDLGGTVNPGRSSIFVAKYDTAGNRQWTRIIGNHTGNYGEGIAVDATGNAYVTGWTYGTLDGVASTGGYDIFVIKFDPSGVKQWTRLFGSSENDSGHAIAVDGSGNSYLTGSVRGSLDGGPFEGEYDIFVAKYDTEGAKQWSTTFGTRSEERGEGIAVDAAGNSYTTGYTRGDLDGNACAGDTDIFVTKYDTNGNKQWTTLLGTPTYDEGVAVAADSKGYIYTTGFTYGDLDGVAGNGGYDIFIIKYDSSGNKQWTKLLGSRDSDYASSIATGSGGNVYMTGTTYGTLGGNNNAGRFDIFAWNLVDSKDGIALETVILILQALTGKNPDSITFAADASIEGRLGLEDAIYFLQRLSGLH